ncbi:MAG: RDD family protein [Verrucomicrobiae bacterium]|nr:RDD family protein [Verrucomicrobiae bacterium]
MLYYYLDAKKEAVGPLTLDQMRDLFNRQAIADDTYVWKDGENKWILLLFRPEYEKIAADVRKTGDAAVKQSGGLWARAGAGAIDVILLSAGVFMTGMAMEMFGLGVVWEKAGFWVACVFGPWIYFAVLEGSAFGASIGKKCCDLIVVDARGKPLGFLRASMRYWLKLAGAVPLFAGWGVALFNPKRLAFHDAYSSAQVISRKNFESQYFDEDR